MSVLGAAFWESTPIAPIPFLAELREMILEQGHPHMPKWKFLFAKDFAIQLQPQARLFSGLALQGPAPARVWFEDRKTWPPEALALTFWISADKTEQQWKFNPRRMRWVRPPARLVGDCLAFRQRVLEALPATQLGGASPTTLLSPHCLICGRHLTDPVSEARMIGPECAGRHPSIPVIRVPEPVR
jgi:Family of unknown function (DUF6011)